MSSEPFRVQELVALESPKVEAIAFSSGFWSCIGLWTDDTDPAIMRIFAVIKGGRLFEYVVSAESRNEKHTVGSCIAFSLSRIAHTLFQIRYLPWRARRRLRASCPFPPFPKCTF